MTGEEDSYDFFDLSGQLNYTINSRIRMDLQGGLRKQNGRGRDLELVNLRSELKVLYRESHFTFGYEFYYRAFISDITRYNGGYIRYERTF
jgi:hypothetical protein